MTYTLVVAFIVAMPACANSNTDKQSGAAAATGGTVVNWAADCADTSPPFFSVTLVGPTTIQYSGGPLVKDKGDSSIEVSAPRFREIARSARAAGSLGLRRAALAASGDRHRYCLRFLFGSTIARVPVTNEDLARGGLQFEKELRKTSQMATLLCPMRIDYLFASGYCEPSRISFALSIGSACDPADVVEIYDDVFVHHYLSGLTGFDEYSTVSPALVDKMAAEASAFGGEFGPVSAHSSVGAAGKSACLDYRFYDIQLAAIDKLSSYIAAKTGVTMQKSHMEQMNCARADIDGSRGTITIRD
jgi:hypothetical protein